MAVKKKLPYWKRYYDKNRKKIQARRKEKRDAKKRMIQFIAQSPRISFEKMRQHKEYKEIISKGKSYIKIMKALTQFNWVCLGFILLSSVFVLSLDIPLIEDKLLLFQWSVLALQITALFFHIYYSHKLKKLYNPSVKRSSKESSSSFWF